MRNLKYLLKTLCREQTIGFVLDINCRQKKLEKLILSKYFLLPPEGTRLPGHVGSEGNQKADELVRKGAVTPLVRPEPFCGWGNMFFKSEIRKAVDVKRSHF